MDSTLSTLVASAEHGDRAAADALFAALYDELHRMARRELAKRGAGVTLGATTLLHEAYLDISDRERRRVSRPQPVHGLRLPRDARADHRLRAPPPGAEARRRVRDHRRSPPTSPDAGADADELARRQRGAGWLEATDARLARIVDLKFFCGFSFVEIAAMLGVSERTVQRDWEKARIYLHRVLRDDASLA